jgi:hypothetical protein
MNTYTTKSLVITKVIEIPNPKAIKSMLSESQYTEIIDL